MADTPGFTHITVSADDDDDVVIQAGIADGPAEAAEGAEAADEAADAADAPEEAEPASDVPEEAEPEPKAEPEAEPEPAAPRAERDGYRETTPRGRCPPPRRRSSWWPCSASRPSWPGTFWPASRPAPHPFRPLNAAPTK